MKGKSLHNAAFQQSSTFSEFHSGQGDAWWSMFNSKSHHKCWEPGTPQCDAASTNSSETERVSWSWRFFTHSSALSSSLSRPSLSHLHHIVYHMTKYYQHQTGPAVPSFCHSVSVCVIFLMMTFNENLTKIRIKWHQRCPGYKLNWEITTLPSCGQIENPSGKTPNPSFLQHACWRGKAALHLKCCLSVFG